MAVANASAGLLALAVTAAQLEVQSSATLCATDWKALTVWANACFFGAIANKVSRQLKALSPMKLCFSSRIP
jgi:hypothetical protein